MTMPEPVQQEGINGTVTIWDVKGVTSWSQLGRPVRVVREVKKRTKRERIAKIWVEREVEEDWRSVVIFPDPAQQPPADSVRRWAHSHLLNDDLVLGGVESLWSTPP